MARGTKQSRARLGRQDLKIGSAAAADRGVPTPPSDGTAATTPHLLPTAAAPSRARPLHQSSCPAPAATSTASSGPPRRAVVGVLNNPDAAAAPKTTPPSLQLQLQVHSTSTPPPARGSNRSYAEAVKGRAKANKNPYDNLVNRLFRYLIQFAIFSEMIANYGGNKRPIITVRGTGNSDVTICEQHLGEYDQELSCAVFNSQHDRFEEFLYPAVTQLLFNRKIVINAVGGMNASFYTMTPSAKPLEDFVRERGSFVSIKSIFDGNFKLCVASDIGMMLFHGFLVYILDIHKHGRTWNGEFSIGDMTVENCLKCRITKEPLQGESRCRVEDLKKIAKIFKPMFTINGKRALYFDVLHTDLRKVDIVKVEAKWYREYLVSHPALKSSIACYNLECGLRHVVASFKFKDRPVQSILGESIPWQTLITKKGTVLYKVFWHRHDPTKHLHPYAPTVGGLLTYKRNFLQHGHEHIKVQDHTELEQFAAKTFHQALPNILRGILSRCEMNGPFKDHWEAYRSSRVGNDGNTERRTGIHISFWEDVSTKTLEDFVQQWGPFVSIKSIFDGNFKLCVASDIGITLVHGFLVYILDMHKHGRTWNGQFSIGDMIVENFLKCRITEVSMQGESRCRAADLHKIAEIFEPMLTINGEWALYFDVLHKDLCAANNLKVESKWYREYLLSHPALKPSIARYNLVCGLHHVVASFKFKDRPVQSILGEWIPWQDLITKGTVLYEVFWHKHDPTKRLHPYAPTVGGLLTYKRNFLQHGDKHIKVQDHTELEQFAAKTFHQALPNVLRGILSRCQMNGPFKDHWEAYRSSRVGNDVNIERRTGIKISF